MSDPHRPTLDAAVKLHQSGQVAQAAEAYRAILHAQPDNPHALHLLGVTMIQTARAAQASPLIERAIAIQPNTAAFHLNLASAYLAQRRIDDCIEHAEKAIVLDPALSAQGYHIAGLAFADDGQFDDAVFCFGKALEADPAAAETRAALEMALSRQGRRPDAAAAAELDRAVAQAKERVAREPNNGEAHKSLARLYEQSGRPDEAIAAYRTATRLLPDDAALFTALGQLLQQQGKPEEAATCFRLADRITPKPPPG